jgi:hypothetical protein
MTVIADETFAVGFTGTRAVLTDFQQKRLLELLLFLRSKGGTSFHHGDCIGADAIAHDLAVRAGFEDIVIHPPTDSRYRAHCHNCPPKGISFRAPAPYLTRNHHIVDDSTVIIACPKGDEIQHSGTWSTVRYARESRYLYIIYPFRVVCEEDPWDWEPTKLGWEHPLDRKDS